ncbi:Fe-S cluster assembly protein SufD [Gramella sp. GC03-9]|uniref:Fe-S cluster assembly protein SufD n=1 Tax=Christiangramia oceanisediminis TaxID=2920386 RepID=A0A9X2I9X2_9FLAO|nr:Fe-S cluster assembly protein SufD [Gramella oceanisediminis]MCP9199463.1 Fe-S cluster assembly protein SufD [Gramella oceanisediminis]
MELKDKLVSSFFALEEEFDSENGIYDIRNQAIKDFENLGFPGKKDENWKYTSLNAVLKHDYSLFPKKEDALEYRDIKKYLIHDIDTYDLVFVDGIYSSHLSQTTHDKIDVCLMSSALSKDKYRPLIENYYNKLAPKTGLNSLNTAFAREGAFIHIHRNLQADKPIQIINFATGNESALMLQPRNLVVVDENSHVQIIERHQSLTDHPVLTNSVTEIYAGKRAFVDYYKIQNDKDSASLIDNTFIEQQGESNVSVHTFSFGGKLTRNNLNFYQKGERIDSTMKGVTIIEDKQHVDHNTLVHHIEPNCESHQDYKGIYGDRSTGVFNGKVVVEKEAQKTNAYQANNNILADDKATINSKPQLEIFADDVKCSHGCTIGQLDEEALFYLQSRGIPRKEARGLLMYAFANNVLESVKIPEVKKRINKLIASKLEVELGFNL